MAPPPLLSLLSLTGSLAQGALVVGGLLVGLAVARALTRRQQESLRLAEERAHAKRVRQLERERIEAVAELGRVAAELAERTLQDGGKAPRRPAIGPRVAPLAGAPPPCEPSPFVALAPPPGAPTLRPPSWVEPAGSKIPDYFPAPVEALPHAEPPAWSSPLVPLPRRDPRQG